MSDEQPQTVPLDRFQKAVESRREIEAKLKEATSRIAELEPLAASAGELRTSLEAERAARGEDANRWAARESFVRVGMDPEADGDAMEIIRGRYDALPKKDRPSLGEWLNEGAKEDRIASALLPKAPEPPAEAPAESDGAPPPVEAAQPRATTTNAGTAPPPPAGSGMSREVYQQRLSSARSGDEVREVMRQYFGE